MMISCSPKVSVLITTYNSSATIAACLHSLSDQDYDSMEVIIVENGSGDGTSQLLERLGPSYQVIYNLMNIGFAGAQNQAIAYAHGAWVLCLNPDTILSPDFISQLVAVGEQDPYIGAVCGKLRRWNPRETPQRTEIIDSTGIYFLRNLRHLDRGSEELDRGQYERPEYVFGATGAAALYRRAMIESISMDGEFFDEDFFAYREDADVAWRAQLMGWRCVYNPRAVGWHVRRVTPSRFRELPDFINRHSIKNRFLMRAKNISWPLYLRLFVPASLRDVLILGYCLLFNRRLLSAFSFLWTKRKAVWKKRKWIQSRRRVSDRVLTKWFSYRPVSFPFPSAGERCEPAK
jgi:GT2 family glycosyltransferase